MANIIYPPFGKIKTIVLPIEYSFLSNHDGDSFSAFVIAYKEKYGIDLSEIIRFTKRGSSISMDFGKTAFYLLQDIESGGAIVPYIPQLNDTDQSYNDNDGEFNVIYKYFGFRVIVDKSVQEIDEQALASSDDIYISYTEI